MSVPVDWLLSGAVHCRVFLANGREFVNQTVPRAAVGFGVQSDGEGKFDVWESF